MEKEVKNELVFNGDGIGEKKDACAGRFGSEMASRHLIKVRKQRAGEFVNKVIFFFICIQVDSYVELRKKCTKLFLYKIFIYCFST